MRCCDDVNAVEGQLELQEPSCGDPGHHGKHLMIFCNLILSLEKFLSQQRMRIKLLASLLDLSAHYAELQSTALVSYGPANP